MVSIIRALGKALKNKRIHWMSEAGPIRRGGVEIAQSLIDSITSIFKTLRTIEPPGGISRERLSVLTIIGTKGPVSITDLARLSRVRTPTTSRMVALLAADGLVRRRDDKLDGRGVLVTLMPKGGRAIARGNRRTLDRMRKALGKLSESQIEALADLAEALSSVQKSGESES
jgi:DNA-binding MarR family transcriptional regulator